MKQAALHTKRKSRKKKSYEKLGITKNEVDTFAKLTTRYIKEWTEKELKNLAINQNVPVCLPNGTHGFLIGRNYMEKLNDHCYRVLDMNQEVLHDFGHKTSAVLYCLISQRNRLNLARKLQNADYEVSKLENDRDQYLYTMRCSLKSKDYTRADIANMRLIEVQTRLRVATEELQKTINTAKYLEIRETQS